MKDNSEIINRLYKHLCRYKVVDEGLKDYLDDAMPGKYYPAAEVLCQQGNVMRNAIFVSDGYLACYAYTRFGEKQLVSLYEPGRIVAGLSFTCREPSVFEWVALPGSYIVMVSYHHMREIYRRFRDAEELARILMAEMTEIEQQRLLELRRPAFEVVSAFYTAHPAMRVPGKLLPDTEVAGYLCIGESTLRRERKKLFML